MESVVRTATISFLEQTSVFLSGSFRLRSMENPVVDPAAVKDDLGELKAIETRRGIFINFEVSSFITIRFKEIDWKISRKYYKLHSSPEILHIECVDLTC